MITNEKSKIDGHIFGDFLPLVIIFTYERPQLLKNAAKSVTEFYPWGDRLIIDDGSQSDEQEAVLTHLSNAGWEVKRMNRNRAKEYGGFYTNMKYGLNLAKERGYKYCLFFEDDEQFIWRDDSYPEFIKTVFKNAPDCIAIQPLLYRRIIDYSDKIEYIDSIGAYRSNRGFNTTCLWNLDKVRELKYQVDDSIGDGLAINSRYFLERGYRLYGQRSPNAAIVPWVESNKLGAQSNTRTKDIESFELIPLAAPYINWLRSRSPITLPYQEYLPLSPNNSDRPIWHQAGKSLNRYYELCYEVNKKEKNSNRHPTAIDSLSTWEMPVRLEKSHMYFNHVKIDSEVFGIRQLLKKIAALLGLKNYKIYRRIREFRPTHYIGYINLKNKLTREVLLLKIEVEKYY
jgi:hypothetical protein